MMLNDRCRSDTRFTIRMKQDQVRGWLIGEGLPIPFGLCAEF